MSTSVVPQTAEEQKASAAKAQADAQADAEAAAPKQLDDLHTEHGDTTIADTVVAKIAGIAAREVSGVYAMGNAARRAISGITSRVTGNSGNASATGGVSVEKGESQTKIDVSVVVEYGVSIVDVSDQIRQNIISAVEHGTGLEVVAVDIDVTDVHLPDDDSDSAATSSAPDDSLR